MVYWIQIILGAIVMTSVCVSIIDDIRTHEISLWKLLIPTALTMIQVLIANFTTLTGVILTITIALMVANDLMNTERIIGRADLMFFLAFTGCWITITANVCFCPLVVIDSVLSYFTTLAIGLLATIIVALGTYVIQKLRKKDIALRKTYIPALTVFAPMIAAIQFSLIS